MAKLPKSLLAHPKRVALEALLAERSAPLRAEGTQNAARVPFDDGFRQALKVALGTTRVMQGLELMAELLAKEQKGLKLVQEKTGQAPPARASRLLILASDGSDRFYREAERLLARHGDRLLAMVVEATGEELGAAYSSKDKAVKALMINDRDAMALFLGAYADSVC
jgi:hypothetical protein